MDFISRYSHVRQPGITCHNNLQSKGNARQIWYAYAENELDTLRSLAEATEQNVAATSLNALLSAVSKGQQAFLTELASDDVRATWAIQETRKAFGFAERHRDRLVRLPSLVGHETSADVDPGDVSDRR